MPIRKRRHTTFRPRKRRRMGPKAKRPVDKAQNRNISKLYRLVKYSKERKYIDQSILNLSLASSWVNPLPRDLTFITTGTDDNQRVGNKIQIHSHHIKAVLTCGDSTQLYRLMVVRFRSQAASLVQLSDALENPSGTSPGNLMSFKKRNTDSRYQILYDTGIKKLAGNVQAAAPAQSVTQAIHDFKIKGNFYTGYNSTSGGGCVQGYTYLVVCTDSAIAPSPSISVISRTIFSG